MGSISTSPKDVVDAFNRCWIKGDDGLIVRADEYHDRAMVEAFLRLFNAPDS